MTVNYGQAAIVIALVLVLLRTYHVLKRRWERRDTCGSLRVKRIYKMEANPDFSNDGRHWHTYTFARCKRCKSFRLIKSEDKCFPLIEIWWRKTRYPGQFSGLEECLRLAGVVSERQQDIGDKLRPPPIHLRHVSPRLQKPPPDHGRNTLLALVHPQEGRTVHTM